MQPLACHSEQSEAALLRRPERSEGTRRDPSLRSGRPQAAVYAKQFPRHSQGERPIASRRSFAPQTPLRMTATNGQTQPLSGALPVLLLLFLRLKGFSDE
jgi:hypothetical protein